MTESDQDAQYQRPLLIAAGIAVVVMVLLSAIGVDLHRCELRFDTRGKHAISSSDGGGELDRDLRLWLDAGELDGVLQTALREELSRSGSSITLTSAATKGGSVTLRVDDASFYTPLYAKARVTAVMGFETVAAPGSTSPRAQGDTRVELSGACYGFVSPATFRSLLGEKLAAPLAKALHDVLD